MRYRLVTLGILWTLLLSSPMEGAECDTDVVPAATLLVPYFEVDLEDPNARTALFSVRNRGAEPVLANVVLWTNLAIPTLQFEVYLAGYDIQTFNLRDVFIHGRLPATGSAVSPHGVLSEPPVAFPGCNDGTVPGAAPVYSDPALGETELAELQAFHTGECFDGRFAGSGFRDRVARGYITVDVVQRCSVLTPADPGYFAGDGSGVADDRNVLTGDYFFVDAGENFAQGEQAVHIEAFPAAFGQGDYTFYKRYVDSSGIDHREPLGTQYSVRYLKGGGFDADSELVAWRDTGSDEAEPIVCGERFPDWYTSSGNGKGLESYRVFIGEEGEAEFLRDQLPEVLPPGGPFPLGFATQSTRQLSPINFGSAYVVLRRATSDDPADWEVLQGWLGVINGAEDRFSVGLRAVRLDSACDPGPIEPAPSDFE